jgi:hypothetical protein
MFKRMSGSASLGVSIVALIVALSGTAGAATTLITTKMLKNGSVTGAKIANNAVTGAKVQNGSLGLSDLSKGAVTKLLSQSATNTLNQFSPQSVVGPAVLLQAGASGTAYASCPQGTWLTGGGFSAPAGHATKSQPGTNNTWTADIINDGGVAVNVYAIAMCI